MDILENALEYIPRYFKVLSKADASSGGADLVLMRLWPSQEHYIQHRTNRDIVVKNRQTGFSTGVLADNAHAFFTQPYERQTIITHDDETSEFLLGTIHRFHNNLPPDKRPKKGYSAGHRISLSALDAYMYIDSAKSDSIGIGHGLTRAHLCLHPDSEVLLSDGTKKAISSLEVGGKTLSKKFGSPVEIKSIFSRPYKGKLCKLIFCGNVSTPLICTPDHRILGSTDGEGWIKAKDVRWIGTPIRNIETRIRSLPIFSYTAGNERAHKKTGDLKLDYDFGWILGLFYAEGSYKNGGLTFSLSPKETDFMDRIKLFSSRYGWGTHSKVVDTLGNIKGREIRGNTLVVNIHSTSLKNIIQSITGENKIMPDWLWGCPKDFLNGIIDGYVDGDGCYNKKDAYFYVTSVRPHLLFQLRELLLSVRHQYAGINYGKARGSWVLYFPMKECNGSIFYKKGSYKYVKFLRMHRQHYVFVKLNKREWIDYEGEVYDIETQGSFKTPSGIVHNSEVAKWPHRKEDQLFADISQTVPVGGFITLESTPKGRANLFYRLYTSAKRGEIPYRAFFYEWWWDVTCIRPVEGVLKYSEEEQILVNNFNLKPEQIKFRREKIAELGDLFYQEYPENDTDCWLSSDLMVFDGVALRRYLMQIDAGRVEGNLTIWKDAIPGERYIIGCDPAGGHERGDYSVATVIRVKTNEYVARFRARVPPDMFGQELLRLGRRFNDALIGVERAFHGLVVLKVLLDNSYPNVYQHINIDAFSGHENVQYGWSTNTKTKGMMISTLASAVRSGDIITWSENFCIEASGYMWDGDKTKKSPGGFDDELDAVMIALQLREQIPILEPNRPDVFSYI